MVLEAHESKQLLNQKFTFKKNNIPLCSSFIVFSSPAVEESSSKCSDEPVAVGDTPDEDATLSVLPYEQIIVKVQYSSQSERFGPFLS